MEQGRQIVFVVLLTVVSALLSVSETRSISSLKVSQTNLTGFRVCFMKLQFISNLRRLFTKTHFGQQEIKYSTSNSDTKVRRVLRKSVFYTSSFSEAS